LEDAYQKNLLKVLKRKYLAIGAFIVVFFIAVGIVLPLLGFELFPTSDEDVLQIKIETPKGTAIEETERRVKRVEKIIEEVVPKKVLASYVTTIGVKGTNLWETASGVTQSHWAKIIINLTPNQTRKISAIEIGNNLDNQLEKIKGDTFKQLEVIKHLGGPPVGLPIDVTFIGNNDRGG